ncbi:hypothetical protein BTI247_56360 [Bacillus thuringiensis Bt18247]|uniref:Uncharacterized protein n=1 Tax=Bacillus thuringiensis Bt18247 TaxID=1423143 RepID=A0A9W3XBP4_BACTU|nr:hypothetical protein BTI247_56360 [Bacillus thuringiensis Bt18247]
MVITKKVKSQQKFVGFLLFSENSLSSYTV